MAGLRSLANDRSIVIKKTDKDIAEAEKPATRHRNVFKDIIFKEKILQELAETSNNLFRNLEKKVCITEMELKYFSIEFKKAINLGKLYLIPNIHKGLFDVPGRSVISNCGTPTEKVSEFLEHVLKQVMQQSRSYIKDSSDFIKKLKEIKEFL